MIEEGRGGKLKPDPCAATSFRRGKKKGGEKTSLADRM